MPIVSRPVTITILAWLVLALAPDTASSQADAASSQTFVASNFRCLIPDSEQVEFKPRRSTVKGSERNVCQIGDWVTADVGKTEFDAWLNVAPETHTLNSLVLSLNGHLLVGNHPNRSHDGSSLTFLLKRNHNEAKNVVAWKGILPRTKLLDAELMNIAIALEGASDRFGEETIGIRVASIGRMLTVAVVYLAILLLFLFNARKMLRDTGHKPATGSSQYSLGRTQMAFWFFVVLGGFLYLWLVTGDLDVVTPGVMALIGISAATGLAATAIGDTKKSAESNKRFELLKQQKQLKSQIEQLTTSSDADKKAAKSELLAKIGADLQTTRASISPASSAGFIKDIVSSEGEVSFPRFQMVAWTAVLGIVFGHSVYTALNMPEFPAALLGLMGLSSGTYVGFKFPSKDGK